MSILGERKQYSGWLTKCEADYLIKYGYDLEQNPPERCAWRDTNLEKNPIISKIICNLEENLNLKVKNGNSFWWVRNYNKGIRAHYDTGTHSLTSWCNLSCTVLLSNPNTFTGGKLYFDNDCVEPDEHYLNCIAYSSMETNQTNKHRVEPCLSGDRWVLLMFFEAVFF